MSSYLVYNISQFNQDEKIYAMNTLFPLITEYNEEFKEYYTYRQIYFKWNINSEAYRLHKQYTDFPDPSYYWVYPKGEEPKERHVLFGTYYIQHEIWKHQFPSTCEDKKFLIVPVPWFGGLGYFINQLAYSLAAAIEADRILIIKKLYNTPWGDPDFCGSDNNSILCYLQPTTSCTIPDEDIQIAYNKNKDFFSTNHIHIKNITAITEYPSVKYICTDEIWRWRIEPSFVKNFLMSANIQFDRNVRWWYWRTQGITFLTRLNERTINWIRDYEKQNCKECKNEYDITLHIRHADKGREMKLIDADVYKEAIKIITSLGMKKNYTIFVNADDQESVDIIHTLPYHVISFNQSRLNYGVNKNKWLNKVGLISLSNLYNLLKGDYCVGTIASNWNQVFYELRSTVGLKSDGFNFEVGIEGCMSYSHCSFKKRRFDCKW